MTNSPVQGLESIAKDYLRIEEVFLGHDPYRTLLTKSENDLGFSTMVFVFIIVILTPIISFLDSSYEYLIWINITIATLITYKSYGPEIKIYKDIISEHEHIDMFDKKYCEIPFFIHYYRFIHNGLSSLFISDQRILDVIEFIELHRINVEDKSYIYKRHMKLLNSLLVVILGITTAILSNMILEKWDTFEYAIPAIILLVIVFFIAISVIPLLKSFCAKDQIPMAILKYLRFYILNKNNLKILQLDSHENKHFLIEYNNRLRIKGLPLHKKCVFLFPTLTLHLEHECR